MALFLVMRYKTSLVAAQSLPTCSRYILALRGHVFYEVTRSLRTSAAEISVLARVLPTLERSAFYFRFCPACASGRTALPPGIPHVSGLKIVLQSCYDHRLQCTP